TYFFQAEDGIRDRNVTGVQTCALPISFDHLALQRIGEINAQIKLGFLIHYPMINAGRYVNMTGLNAVSIHPYKKIADESFIAECHKYNLKVYPYTVSTNKEAARLINIGADGYFTSLETLY